MKEKLGSIKYFHIRKSRVMSDNYNEMSDGELADKLREYLAEQGVENEHER